MQLHWDGGQLHYCTRSITLLHFACLRRQRGQELGNPVLVNLAQARCALQYPHQIAVCIQTTFLSRFNQAVDHGTGLCAGRSIGKQPVLPAHHKRLNTAFSTVIAQFQSAVFQIANEIWPLLFQISSFMTMPSIAMFRKNALRFVLPDSAMFF